MLVSVSDVDFGITKVGDVFVDFYSDSCGPCKMVMPLLDSLSEEYPNIKFVKANVANNEESASIYGVRGLPTFILLRDGEVLFKKSGACNKQTLKEMIENNYKE